MSLKLRRQFLQTAIRGVGALFAASAVKAAPYIPDAVPIMKTREPSPSRYIGEAANSYQVDCPEPSSPPDSVIAPIRDFERARERKYAMAHCIMAPDPEFQRLGSVAPWWRGMKTRERADERDDMFTQLRNALNAWYEDPVNMVAQQIKGSFHEGLSKASASLMGSNRHPTSRY